ncbi:hypothetical protein D5E85_18560 [Vibrio parahaemolyticus]|uniref:Uncharacterized protein n=1 Tax=Vibrio parahaemolyticus serotype O3:K6 (strain RIMD 2210633) TaxID=223926 RepID=Q87P03_VIBPA|nr:hypothetical protein D5E85_18560 [Vibrio parahaemolyticus]TBT40010.1 hypothetical protein D5E79_19265 [Vibrio parahaemolyticus]BAC59978.1 hypothetical protein [Vibrio parahaemolyticus RIMD 2210633]
MVSESKIGTQVKHDSSHLSRRNTCRCEILIVIDFLP